MTTKLTARQQDKLTEATQLAIRFTVHGKGRFPFDMLRYDRCWPALQDDGVALGLTTERGVRLCGLRTPTEGRWESFGWHVTLV